MMLIATPATTWLPAWLTQATPCKPDKATAAPNAARKASGKEAVATPTAAAAKAAASILPSNPMSTTPLRSLSNPASAHKISGTDTRKVEAMMEPQNTSSMGHLFGFQFGQECQQV